MHNWRLLIPILAVIGAVASFSERTFIDVRQQCFERLERDSPLSRSESDRSERLFSASSFSNSPLATRETNRRCHSDRAREFLNHRRSDLVNREDRPATRDRNRDFRIALRDRKILHEPVIERSIRLTSASRDTRDVIWDVENKYRTTTRQFDSRRVIDERRSADDWVPKNDDVVGATRKTQSTERVLSRLNENLEARQQKSRSVLESFRSQPNDQERRFPEQLDAERLVRTTRIVRSRNNDRTSAERRALLERDSLSRSITKEIFSRNTVPSLQTRENRNMEIGMPTTRSTTTKSEKLVSIAILPRNSEQKAKLSIGQDSRISRQDLYQRSYSASENLARLTMHSHNAPGFTRDIEDRTRSSGRFFESRTSLVERRLGEQYKQISERFDDNRLQNTRDARFTSQTRTERETKIHRTRSMDGTNRAIDHSNLKIRDEGLRHRSKSLNTIEVNMRQDQNIRRTRSGRERTNLRIIEFGLQHNRITRDLSEQFSKNLREMRAREESLNELRKYATSEERLNKNLREVRAREESPNQIRQDAILKERFNRNLREVRAREESRNELRQDAISKDRLNKNLREVRAREESRNERRQDEISNERFNRNLREVRAREESRNELRQDAITKDRLNKNLREVRAREESRNERRQDAISNERFNKNLREVRAREESLNELRKDAISDERFNRNLREVRAREESRNELRQDAISKDRLNKNLREVRAREESRNERRQDEISNERFNRNLREVRAREESRNELRQDAISKDRLNKNLREVRAREESRNERRQDAISNERFNKNLREVRAREESLNELRKDAISDERFNRNLREVRAREESRNELRQDAISKDRLNKNLREVRAREESLNELRKDAISDERFNRNLREVRAREESRNERRQDAISNERFNKNLREVRAREEFRNELREDAISKERLNKNLREVRAREESRNELRQDAISKERLNKNLREVRAREESLNELRQDAISRRDKNEERPLIKRSLANDRLSRFSRNIDSQLRRTKTRRPQPNTSLSREQYSSLDNKERIFDVKGSSRLENRSDSRSRQARTRYSLSQSADSRRLGTRSNTRIQPSQSIESIRDDLTRSNRRHVLKRTQMREQRTRSSFDIRVSRKSQSAEEHLRRQSREEIYLQRSIVQFSPLQSSRFTVRLYPKDTLKDENRASNRIFAVELISTRAMEDIFGKNLNYLEWKTISFYILQSAYVCAILFHIIGGSGFKGDNHNKINDWIPRVRHSIKVD